MPVDDTAMCMSCSARQPLTPSTRVMRVHQVDGTRCPGTGQPPKSGSVQRGSSGPAGAGKGAERRESCSTCDYPIRVEGGRMVAHRVNGIECAGSGRSYRAAPAAHRTTRRPSATRATTQAGATAEPSGPAAHPAAPARAKTGNASGPNSSTDGSRRPLALIAAGVAAAVLAASIAVSWSLSADEATVEAAAGRTEPTSTPSTRQSLTPAPKSTAATSVDTSLRDALREAGVSSDMVTRIGELGRETGYLTGMIGLDDVEGFAYMQVLTCQEVNSGYRSYDDVYNTDVSDGAPAASAETMVTFLRTTYCPSVTQPDETAVAATAPGLQLQADGSDPNGMRGVMSTAAFFDAAYAPVPVSRCTSAVGPEDDARAYEMPGGGLLCVSVPSHAGWKSHIISVDIVFDPPVPQAQAVAAALAVLPADGRVLGEQSHKNPPHGVYSGSCLGINISTPNLGAYYRDFQASWDNGATALLYSGRQTSNGADTLYDPARVRQVSVSPGFDEPSLNGDYLC